MSRTEAVVMNVLKDGNHIKLFSSDVAIDGNNKDVSTLLDVLNRSKEMSNDFLTTLVEAEQANVAGGAVISHSKRKNVEDTANAKRQATSSNADEIE